MTLEPPRFSSLDDAYNTILRALLQKGKQSSPRLIPTKELIGCTFSITDPRCRYISNPVRRWSLAYAIGEFCWHTSASDSVDHIAWYAPYWRKVAGPNANITGSSYGATIFRKQKNSRSQWESLIDLIRSDSATRRAVLFFSTPNEDALNPESDVSCTLSLQFLLRDGKLDAVCSMRSNDVITGLPYDVFFFTMLQEMAAVTLGCEIGCYYHSVGSLHLYEKDFRLAEEIVSQGKTSSLPMQKMESLDEMPLLHQVEFKTRNGTEAIFNKKQFRDSYWSEFAKVVSIWNNHKNAVKVDESITLNDKLLAHLFSLRPFGSRSKIVR
jgi:thymidylate synthase